MKGQLDTFWQALPRFVTKQTCTRVSARDLLWEVGEDVKGPIGVGT